MKKIIIFILFVLLIIILGFFLFNNGSLVNGPDQMVLDTNFIENDQSDLSTPSALLNTSGSQNTNSLSGQDILDLNLEEVNTTIADILNRSSFFNQKKVLIEGFVFGEDIKNEIMQSNLYLNLRDINNMNNNNKVISMQIMSDPIKNLLINEYKKDNFTWAKIAVGGLVETVSLGSPNNQSVIIKVVSLSFLD